MLPKNDYITKGIWTFTLMPIKIISGFYRFYLPSAVTRNSSTRFYQPDPNATFTIPSTAAKVITVGAYNAYYDADADFSGRGFREYNNIYIAQNSELAKPDLVAPGVDIITTIKGNSYQTFSGTSFATPFVTGSSALLMEWGIIKKNDPFLYGEKVKAYLVKGARQLPGYEYFPNSQVGWGALCVKDSLPQ